ncbi:MAG TPA: ATP-binding cassette domain-containing protein, partial [Azospirillaceae bacterium]|nr:ATP-binding cassette domain-containing protein [Azospirillaceae bacterium]
MRKLPAVWEPWLLAAGAAGLVWFAVFHAGPYGLRVLTVAGAYALAVLGYQLVFGLCGALSLAQGAFFGVGAYVSGFLALRWGLDFAVTAPLAIIAPMTLALLVGGAVLRLESHYFALATLGVAQIVLLTVINGPEALGGANGLPGVPGVALFGFAVPRGLALAGLVWGLVALGAFLTWRLTVSRFGRALVLVREDALTAACLGLDVGRLRLAAFALSAGFAGLGGALAAHAQRVISPEVLEFPVMVAVLTMAVIGGRGRAAGAVVGALLIVFLPEWLGGLGQARLLFYAAALLAAVVLLPDGVMGLFGGKNTFSTSPRRKPGSTLSFTLSKRLDSGLRRNDDEGATVGLGSAPLIVENLRKSFGGVRAVDGVSFTLNPGEIVGLIGPNGSGKTTLINLLSAVEPTESGAVRLGELLPPGLAHVRARAGLARTFHFFPTGQGNVIGNPIVPV